MSGRVGEAPGPTFLLVAGGGEVSGDDNVFHRIAAGQAALWTAGEPYTTKADEELVAIVVEAPHLSASVPPSDR